MSQSFRFSSPDATRYDVLHATRSSTPRAARMRRMGGALAVAFCIVPAAASSQNTSTSPSDSLATVTTDTGPMAPGHDYFSHYNTPSLCLAAVRNTQLLAERTLEVRNAQLQDSLNAEDEAMGASTTLRERVLGDTAIVTRLATVARACAAHLRADSVSADDLSDYFTLALFAQDDALAQNIIKRWTSAPTRKERDAIWIQIVESYLAANPARLAATQSVIAQLDTSKAVSLDARLQSRQRLLMYAMHWFNTALARDVAENIIAVGAAPGASRTGPVANAVASSYMVLMHLALMNQPSELTALGQRAKKALAEFAPDPNYWPFDADAISVDSLVTILSGKSRQQRATVGMPMDSLAPAYAFLGPDSGASGNGASRRATLTVVLNANGSLWGEDHYERVFAQLKRWHQQYGAKLGIRIVTSTSGYWVRAISPSGPAPADSEAHRTATLWQDYFKLPSSVAVLETTFQPRPDGVRLADPVPFIHKYLPASTLRPEGALLTDAQGRLRYAGQLDSDLRATIAIVVAADRP